MDPIDWRFIILGVYAVASLGIVAGWIWWEERKLQRRREEMDKLRRHEDGELH